MVSIVNSGYISSNFLIRDFDAAIPRLILGFAPRFLASQGLQARNKLQALFAQYYESRLDEGVSVSETVRARGRLFREYGWTSKQIGQVEVSLLVSATSNAFPTMFWTIMHVFSPFESLDAVRQELLSVVEICHVDGMKNISIDVLRFNETDTPLLNSIYKETLRLHNTQVSTRRVMTDTIISDHQREYLLKAGADVQMPAGILHHATSVWGEDARSFNPRRFLKPASGDLDPLKEREQTRSFIPFGGGRNLCPGRNFAFAEIMGMVAILALGFDIEQQPQSQGSIVVPPSDGIRFGYAVERPTRAGQSAGAVLVRRLEWENAHFIFIR